MARINRVPRGLLSLLGTKSLGRTPQEIDESVRGVVDLTQFYLSDKTLVSAAAAEVLITPSVGTVHAINTIPNGEAWFVYNITTKLVSNATIAVNLIPTIVVPDNVANVQHQLQTGSSSATLTSGVNQLIRSNNFDNPWLLGAGTQIGSYCHSASTPGTNNLTVVTSVLYVQVDT
jgi:hypothetical protein